MSNSIVLPHRGRGRQNAAAQADFERIDAEMVAKLGADKFWPAPLREVRRAS